MNGEVVFLLEEPSMKGFLNLVLPRVAPQLRFVLVAHEGKSDLVGSFPRKLRAWRTPGARFVVVHDQDNADCRALKSSLRALIPEFQREHTLIRIACRELESWILGDFQALATAFDMPDIAGLSSRQKYRDPDKLGNPAEELRKLIPSYQKISGAQRVAGNIGLDNNTSRSFQVFLQAVRRLAEEGASS